MSENLHYPHAPIVEAVIDIQAEPRPELKVHDLKRGWKSRLSGYAEPKDVFVFSGSFGVKPGSPIQTSATQQKVGFKFAGEAGRNILQFRTNGFTFSRLKPYESWNPFRAEARSRWCRYREEFRPKRVARLAVRYINRIEIPGSKIELKDYFRTMPEISPILPQTLEGFFMQVKLPQDDLRAKALINQTIAEPVQPGLVSILLDIDLFRADDVPQDEAEIWVFFEQLHDRKNHLFEACLTDKARELFQ